MNLYKFLTTKFNINGYTLPYYKDNDILSLQHELDNRHIVINYETLDLIFFCYSNLEQYMEIIKFLYLPDLAPHEEFNGSGYYSLFYTLQFFYKDEINIDPDIKDVLRIFHRNSINRYEYGLHAQLFFIIFRYYWLNKDKLSVEKLDNLVNKIKFGHYDDLFVMNGIITEKGRIKATQENTYLFLDSLFKERNKIIIK